MKFRYCWCLLAAVLIGGGASVPALAVTLLGPTPYLSYADSPFNGVGFNYWHLEDFEDGLFNTPGVSVNGGGVLGPDPMTDSVDGDDGVIDGLGNNGHSWYSQGMYPLFEFVFDQASLGSLPTHAGIVCTDIGQSPTGLPGFGTIEFNVWGSGGAWLGSITDAVYGDGEVTGGTAEDRFFGVIHDAGVSRITISASPNLDWEVDHLQYGASTSVQPVPEAGPGLLLAGGLVLLAIYFTSRRRIRSTAAANAASVIASR